MRIKGELNQAQLRPLQAEIKRMNLTPEKRRRLLYRIMKNGVLAATERNIKRQKTPDGTKYSKRHSKRKAKMLSKITKNIKIKATDNYAAAFFVGQYKSTATKSISAGVVAKMQQDGLKVTQNKSMFENQTHNKEKGSITARQIRRLRKLGHTHSKNKKIIRSSVKWLQANLSESQAGVTIRHMMEMPEKNSWDIKIPDREFLGISDADFNKSLKRELKNINFGGRQGANS
ncbi:phage virion morphogenesis protein [Gilliamella sp. WF3-4]|uniref:phage virion morphogenesis protein n=1 Tax=Gilliamella sp. WF3-4 TaxID=3120255 RepID=UPI00080DFF06|nr:phage virion morphogenesis protein [Gilliamella apicola]OCG19631.1 hypothetical protein A9G47_00525 [Gilliamella apicola]